MILENETDVLNLVTRSGLRTRSNDNLDESDEYSDDEYDSSKCDNYSSKYPEYTQLEDHLIIPKEADKDLVNTLKIHRVLGHASLEKTIIEMKKLNMKFVNYHCNLCAKHKLVRKINKSSRRIIKNKLKLISCDTSGKFQSPCFDKAQYFIIFVNHYSSMKFVETFHEKQKFQK